MFYEFSNFGSKLFDDSRIKAGISSDDYSKYTEAKKSKNILDSKTADRIAEAMKNWAVENGCTHYTHWFHPLNGSTAEKHNSFIDEEDDKPILRFSGKSLIKDEPDASSFPSGGLRATFEARGYTYWDITSPAFIRGHVLYIPTIFVSYTGDSLDTKGPLLKSINAVDKAATSLMQSLGYKDVKSVMPCTGLEQEYFLVDRSVFLKRRDLILTGKTLFGTVPPKSQELERHYCGSIPERINSFMEDVNVQLWDLGIYAKSEHNEVAPGQFELVPVYSSLNKAIDQNMIIMDILGKTALKHGLVCLLHESPFKGVNGSGKHNNYSLLCDNGINMFSPGKTPESNLCFFLAVAALIKAVDKYADLIRLSSSDSGNDFRLGSNEAPPAIVSMHLGDVIEEILASLKDGDDYHKLSISHLPKDTSDRNRTSPVAFTGNKFEFRMLGSSLNPSFLNTVINTSLAEVFEEITEALKECDSIDEVNSKAVNIIKDIYKKHGRVIFSGNGYDRKWPKEAEQRGLEIIPTFYEAISHFLKDESVALFEKHGVFSRREIEARSEIMYESYVNVRSIETKTLTAIVYQDIIPSYIKELKSVTSISPEYISESMKTKAVKLMDFIDQCSRLCGKVEDELEALKNMDSYTDKGRHMLEKVLPEAEKLRNTLDTIEHYISRDNLPCPGYEELFFSIDY